MPISPELQRERRRNGLCYNCGESVVEGKTRCAQHLKESLIGSMRYYTKNRKPIIAQWRRNRSEARRIVLEHYGNKCACCGDTTPEFLQIDHINGGGEQHKKKDPSARDLTLWIIKHKFPEGFQLLCANCNWSKGIWGYCPHE